jgi:carbonic anhydrase/acetyltransferase-like protein (isoleucine patch superfamily)
MSLSQNTRSLVIEVEGVDSRAAAVKWLTEQPETIVKVTTVLENGTLVQRPVIEDGAFVDPTAQLIGGMIVKCGCYIGPLAVIRLDEKESYEPLIIGEDSNIQDCAIVHSATQHIGRKTIVAHQAIVHGARIEDHVTIYIQAVVDGGGAVVGKNCFLHQGSYVGKGINVPEDRYIAPGAKVLTQARADALPVVPKELKALREHVIEHNMAHVNRHLKAQNHF